MSDDTNYNDQVRKLTTAAEQDDAVSTGKILTELGPERWGNAVKDMLALNKKDQQDVLDKQKWDVFIPTLSAELDKSGTSETLIVHQQGSGNAILPVAKITEDITGRNIQNPADPKVDLVRQLTTAAEQGDAVGTARLLRSVGSDKWGEVTKGMLELNHQDIITRKNLDTRVPFITVGYERKGTEETIEIFQEPQYQTLTPLAKITDRK